MPDALPDIAALRKEYAARRLGKADLDADPIRQFSKWLADAVAAELPEPTAMSLATCGANGEPSSRTVLLKALDERGFTFFTNYASRKGREIAENPHGALNFFWPLLERQVCVTGVLEKVSKQESEDYFHARPIGSQLGAWASSQSEVVPDRAFLEHRLQEMSEKFANCKVPLPKLWGGFCLIPNRIEFWQGRPNRLHDRLVYARGSKGVWKIDRLSP